MPALGPLTPMSWQTSCPNAAHHLRAAPAQHDVQPTALHTGLHTALTCASACPETYTAQLPPPPPSARRFSSTRFIRRHPAAVASINVNAAPDKRYSLGGGIEESVALRRLLTPRSRVSEQAIENYCGAGAIQCRMR